MNIQLFLAGCVAAVGALLHGGLPEAFAFLRHGTTTPLPSTTLPRPLRFLVHGSRQADTRLQWRYLRAGWHFLTIDAATTAVLLILAAVGVLSEAETIGKLTAVRFAAYGCLWFAVVAIQHSNVLRAPQWLLFATIAGLAFWGGAVA